MQDHSNILYLKGLFKVHVEFFCFKLGLERFHFRFSKFVDPDPNYFNSDPPTLLSG